MVQNKNDPKEIIKRLGGLTYLDMLINQNSS